MIDPETQEVDGYYAYYSYFDNNDWTVKVWSYNDQLTQIHEFVLPKMGIWALGEPVYNGNHLLFYTSGKYEIGKNNIQYTFYSIDPIGGGEPARRDLRSHADSRVSMMVLPSEVDDGFFMVMPWEENEVKKLAGQYCYYLMKLDAGLKDIWSRQMLPPKDLKGWLAQEAFAAYDRVMVVQNTYTYTKLIKSPELLCFDSQNGDLLYRLNLYDEDRLQVPSEITILEDGTSILVGEYFEGARVKGSNSTGMMVSQLDASGERTAYNFSSWSDGIQKQMKKSDFAITGKNKIIVQDVIRSEDGGFQVVGESFSRRRKSAKSPDRAASAVNVSIINAVQEGRYFGNHKSPYENPSANGPSVLMVQDLIVFDYDQGLELTNVNQIEKDYTKLYAFAPYPSYAGLKLGKVANQLGYMDFGFTQYDSESGAQQLVYNSLRGSQRHIGIVNIEKGTDGDAKRILLSQLENNTPGTYIGKIGTAKGNNAKVLVYYAVHTEGSKTATIKMYLEDLESGSLIDDYVVSKQSDDEDDE